MARFLGPLLAMTTLFGAGLAVPTSPSSPLMEVVDVAEPVEARQAAWPNGPLVVDGRWMRDASGKNVTYAGVNWPGHGEVMVPEGLQYQSIEYIVSKIKSLGMNAIRLTFAIQMVDEIYANGGTDIPLDKAFVQGLGQANGTKILNQFLSKNPQFTAKTTRLQVFDAVAAECYKQQIYVHVDNHMSRAAWCCSTDDGNGWWGDRDFNVSNWLRGLAYMAEHGKRWPAFTSMSLRNEPRQPSSGAARNTYNWQTWYTYVKQGADAINKANRDPLIFLSGLSFDTFLTPVVRGEALSPGTGKFSFGDFPGYGTTKLVLEIHNYENSQGSCTSLQNNLYNNGFQALTSSAMNKFPVLLTEYGFQMDSTTWRGVYASCIASYMAAQKAGFFIWVLAGSYYIRSGRQDYEESWGLFNHDWSAWRSQAFIDGQMIPMVKGTLA